MKVELLKLVTPEGVEVEYVRTIRQEGRLTLGQSILLSRYTEEQQKAIREGRPI
ncbi:hypothetical protein [Pseudomonas sp. BN415]|uniref:hypothetical protein n=1 Tax=Pseudomonas sp. BN415 TaxID=2567889 RepID=UPI00245580F6|nr:hypothetical protein [Pseudomonas sp. BN415]